MSLDWNTGECPHDGELSGWIPERDEDSARDKCFIHPDTNSLAWGAFCGFHIGGELTPKKLEEVNWRIQFLKKINRPWMSDKSFPTQEALDAHLGMRTNCDTKTRKQWLAFVTACLSDEVTRSLA